MPVTPKYSSPTGVVFLQCRAMYPTTYTIYLLSKPLPPLMSPTRFKVPSTQSDKQEASQPLRPLLSQQPLHQVSYQLLNICQLTTVHHCPSSGLFEKRPFSFLNRSIVNTALPHWSLPLHSILHMKVMISQKRPLAKTT